MPKLEGPISTRLRKMFGASDPVWTPQRPASPKTKGKVPSHVQGTSMTGRKKK